MKKADNILPENIRDILSKYYDGQTSVEEERMLRKYFAKHNIPDSLMADQAVVMFGNHDDNLNLFPNNELWEAIKQSEAKQHRAKTAIRYAASAAASLIVLISVGLVFYFSSEKRDNLTVDTYSNPEEAYKAVQKYLGFASKKLSYAYTEMKPIEMLSVPSEAMKPFSEIDKNFSRLNELKRISSTSQQLENISVFSNYIDVNDKN